MDEYTMFRVISIQRTTIYVGSNYILVVGLIIPGGKVVKTASLLIDSEIIDEDVLRRVVKNYIRRSEEERIKQESSDKAIQEFTGAVIVL